VLRRSLPTTRLHARYRRRRCQLSRRSSFPTRREAAFPRLEARTPRSPLQNDELLAQEQILGREPSAQREEFNERDQDVTEEAQHGDHHARGACRAQAREDAYQALPRRERTTAISNTE
jgi:hypothetical protein